MAVASLPPLLAYPERTWPEAGMFDRAASAMVSVVRARDSQWSGRRLRPVLGEVDKLLPATKRMSDAALRLAARQAGAELRASSGWSSAARVLAPVCEAASRVLGQQPFPPQIQAAYGCVEGMMVEMATGEGKTLAAAVAAATIALSGTPVHLLTVNRYLAERDAAFAAPLHRFFGMETGLVTEAVLPDQRRAAYRCPITVAVNKDIAFDYMRDRLAGGRSLGNARRKVSGLNEGRIGRSGRIPLLRGLYHAIIDEADSVLIDEARTPLILSGGSGADRVAQTFDEALALSQRLRPGAHYLRLEGERRCILLPAGRQALTGMTLPDAEPPWDVAEEREHLIEQALTARHMLLRDEHYMVRDGKAMIVDEFTGRVLPDRTWNDGLQELVERKEGLALSDRHDPLARMTYQRFARRYRQLSGLSGTLREVAGELYRVYDVRVVAVPTHRPDRKTQRRTVGHATEAEKWREIATRAANCHAMGVPVLIGTRTLAASQTASDALRAAGLPHAVLSAAQDAAEAQIIAGAGQPGAITVATNMAGRGTDIRIDDATEASGGLRVIVSEPHEARRIDRQLIGRCGRQGQRGETEGRVSLDDALIARHARVWERGLARALLRITRGRSVAWVAGRAQNRCQRLHAAMRRDLLRADVWIEDAIAFAGAPE